MKPSRTSQPYRKSTDRAPSPVLDRMLAGRAGPVPGAGAALSKAMGKVPKKSQRMMPRQ